MATRSCFSQVVLDLLWSFYAADITLQTPHSLLQPALLPGFALRLQTLSGTWSLFTLPKICVVETPQRLSALIGPSGTGKRLLQFCKNLSGTKTIQLGITASVLSYIARVSGLQDGWHVASHCTLNRTASSEKLSSSDFCTQIQFETMDYKLIFSLPPPELF